MAFEEDIERQEVTSTGTRGAQENTNNDVVIDQGQHLDDDRHATAQGNNGGDFVWQNAYNSPQDFPFSEDIEEAHFQRMFTGKVHRYMMLDVAYPSKRLAFLAVILTMAFIVISVWQGLVVRCKVRTLCDLFERSTELGEVYLFKTAPFRIPTAFAWMCLTAGSAGLVLFSLNTYGLFRNSVGSADMVQQATILRKGSGAVLTWQCLAASIPAVMVFLLVGLGVNWQTAGTLLIGFLLTAFICFVNMALGTRGNLRVLTAVYNRTAVGCAVAFRTGASMALSTLSLGLIGVSSLYLITRDVRSLFGLSLGAALMVLFVRLSGTLFKRSLRTIAERLSKRKDGVPLDKYNPPNAAALISAAFADFCGPAASFFENYITSVGCAAALGSSLAFVYRNRFALCVLNHLHVEQTCGPFGYPQQLGYATYICKNDGLYLEYPSLSTWASNTAFVAVPFILAAITMIWFTLSTFGFGCKAQLEDWKQEHKQTHLDEIRFPVRRTVLVGSLVITACSAAVFFGLFGPRSAFYKSRGFGSGESIPRVQLDGSSEQCAPLSTSEVAGATVNPLPLPRGGQLISDMYRPVYMSGLSYGRASGVAWRLFVCHLIGIALSLSCFWLFNSVAIRKRGKRDARAAGEDAYLAVMHGLGRGLAVAALPYSLLLAGVLGTYRLFGAYGVAMATQGFMSCFGMCIWSYGMGLVSCSAEQMAQMGRLSPRLQERLESLRLSHDSLKTTLSEILAGSYTLTAVCIFFVALEHSGILPSPRELTGSPERAPTSFISDIHAVSLHDLHTVLGAYIGIGVPFFVAGSVMMCFQPYMSEAINKLFRQGEKGLKSWAEAVFSRGLAIDAIRETLLPVLIVTCVPMAVGFGLGRRALLSMLVSVLGISQLLGEFLFAVGETANGARDLLSLGVFGNAEDMDGQLKESVHALAEVLGFSSGLSPVFYASGKVVGMVSLVGIVKMGDGAWSGGAVLAGVLVVFTAFMLWNVRKRGHLKARGLRDVERRKKAGIPGPRKTVSPFYVAEACEAALLAPPHKQAGEKVRHEAQGAEGSTTGADAHDAHVVHDAYYAYVGCDLVGEDDMEEWLCPELDAADRAEGARHGGIGTRRRSAYASDMSMWDTP